MELFVKSIHPSNPTIGSSHSPQRRMRVNEAERGHVIKKEKSHKNKTHCEAGNEMKQEYKPKPNPNITISSHPKTIPTNQSKSSLIPF
jgi:hypothetical protein